jgi:hypothetical protein
MSVVVTGNLSITPAENAQGGLFMTGDVFVGVACVWMTQRMRKKMPFCDHDFEHPRNFCDYKGLIGLISEQ